MKVEYTCTYARVNEIIDQSIADEHEIEFIELNPTEWYAFNRKAAKRSMTMTELFSGTPFYYRQIEIRRRKP